MSRKKILWLASWYPNRIHPLNGDFIQRHARAVSLYHDVTVLFVMRDKSGAVTNDVLTEQATAENLTEQCIYYHVGNATGFFSKIISQLRYRQLFKKAIRRYILQNGTPDLVHVHVTLKAGALALWTKKKYGVPFVITEHWTGFLPEAEDYFKKGSAFFQWLCRRVWKRAASISAVSGYLHGHLKKLLPAKDMRIIPNVVDTAVFQPQLFQNPMPHVRFIHVSGLGYQKNAKAIINAFAHIKEKGISFQLHIIAPQQSWLRQLVENLNLSDAVFFNAEMPQAQLAEQMQKADALILYSRYETFGCVVAEAAACGLPAIVSAIAPMHELIKDGVNGVFAESENAAALAEKISWFINNRDRFNAAEIARKAQARFNYKTVGLQFGNWYDAVLKKIRLKRAPIKLFQKPI